MDARKGLILAGTILAVCAPSLAQTAVTQTSVTQTTSTTTEMTGVSNPPQEIATSNPDADVAQPPVASPAPPPAPVVVAVSAPPPMPIAPASANADGDADISNGMPTRPGELSEGAIVRIKLAQPISTSFTRKGDAFAGTVCQDILQNGLVVIPSGAILRGHVTESSESRVATGRSKLHLRAEDIIMPDGTHLLPHAVVIDTDQTATTKVDSEGSILSKKGVKRNLEITGTLAGTGAGAGALVAGPTGAVVGTLVGAGIGTGHWMMQEQVSALPQDATVDFQLTQPMSIRPVP